MLEVVIVVLRRAKFMGFSLALLLAACGRQITPNPPTSDLAGDLDIRFQVSGTLAFSSYDYQIVVSACGGGVPYPSPSTNSYKNYTYSFNVGTSPYGVLTVYPVLLQYKLTAGTTGFTPIAVSPNPSYETLNTDSNGQGNEFELIVNRALLDNPLKLSQPCPSEAGQSNTWIINFIVLTPAGVPVDSLGQGGPTDVSYPGITVDTQSPLQMQVVKQPGISASYPAAAIVGGEVDNYP